MTGAWLELEKADSQVLSILVALKEAIRYDRLELELG